MSHNNMMHSVSLSLLFSISHTSSAISDEVMVYKFSKEKAISWLRAKVAAQASSLEEKGVYVGTGSQSSMLVRSNKRRDISKSMPLYSNFKLIPCVIPYCMCVRQRVVSSDAQSNSHKCYSLNLGDYVKYACGMVCEYLPKELANELEDSYR